MGQRLEDEDRDLRQRVGKHEIVHSGERMQRVMAQVDRVAASETRVCILGETGTGKELIARALHERSPRKDGPFVTLNSATWWNACCCCCRTDGAVDAALVRLALPPAEADPHTAAAPHTGSLAERTTPSSANRSWRS